jgi:hypothetical protein
MRRFAGLILAVGICGAIGLLSGCGAPKETCDVGISYVLEPTKKLPEGLNSIAILDASAQFDGTEDSDRAKKWSKFAADLMEDMIQTSATKYNTGLAIAKREDTAKVLAEKDLKAAGLVDAGTASKAGQLLNVQALITSKLNIRVEVKHGKKTTVDPNSFYGGGWRYGGWGGGSAGAREADEIARNMTVQCSFSMIDAATSQAYVQYAPEPFQKFDHKAPGAVFGSSHSEASLDSVDAVIGELVKQGVREFVSMFVPCEVSYQYNLRSGNTKASAMGIRMLRGDDVDGALEQFKAALAQNPEDHRSAFGAGVTSELKGDWESALKYYRQASMMPKVDQKEMRMYLAAKTRVAAQKDRIRKKT